jgi:hypothetical protein
VKFDEVVKQTKSLKLADLSQKHTRCKLSTATVNQPIVRTPRLFSGVDFTRLLLFFHFFFHFRGFDEPIAFVSVRSSRKPRSTEEKLENGLGPKIGATAGPGVTSAAIRG